MAKVHKWEVVECVERLLGTPDIFNLGSLKFFHGILQVEVAPKTVNCGIALYNPGHSRPRTGLASQTLYILMEIQLGGDQAY